jgi:hypothetical protein
MSIVKSKVVDSLSPPLPEHLVESLIAEYQDIKQKYLLGHLGPSELNAGRFCECVLRIIEDLDQGSYTPMGNDLDTGKVIRRVENNTNLPDGIRLYIPRLCRVLLDVRNSRDVAHVEAEVSPNLSDSLLVSQGADWILTELIRNYYPSSISVDEAQSIVDSIDETEIPVVQDVGGFLRVLNPNMPYKEQVLAILHHQHPSPVSDQNLIDYTGYKNSTRMKNSLLPNLHEESLIHYSNGDCRILRRGIIHVEENIDLGLRL